MMFLLLSRHSLSLTLNFQRLCRPCVEAVRRVVRRSCRPLQTLRQLVPSTCPACLSVCLAVCHTLESVPGVIILNNLLFNHDV